MGFFSKLVIAVAALTAVLSPTAYAQRPMENLGRGVVAVRSSNTAVLVGWRLLGLDPKDIGFNIYRATSGGTPQRLNSNVLTGGTNFRDTSVDLTKPNTYHVRPELNGKEEQASGTFTLRANNAREPVVRIPIKRSGQIKYLWVGDLDGDGEFDYVLHRQTVPQKLEAYRSDGKFLWEVNMGPNSNNQNNISPGSATVNVGHWDGVTVYDFDSDGYAEVAVRIANGVVFGDGQTFRSGNGDNEQFIAILEGRTGKLRGSSKIPSDYQANGPLAARFGVGYLDGKRPYLVGYLKNRQSNGAFNLMMGAWTFNGNSVTMAWKWLRGGQDAPDGHNTRVIDVNGDGMDEVCEIGFCLNGDGKVRYLMGPKGIIHGDRFHIAKIDPDRSGLQGYGVQQSNPSKLLEYYFDARDGTIIWEHFGSAPSDVGRGMVGDIDPRFAGMEAWSFNGLYNAKVNRLTEPNRSLAPWPHLGLWWDGDALMELYNDGKFEKWNWNSPSASNSLPRLLRISDYGGTNEMGPNPLFHGDILGDWREEVIVPNANYDELLIFSTDIPSDIRLYTLSHNPAYRNAMTLKGYVQSHHVDYFLGDGMKTPPTPNIYYVTKNGSPNPNPDPGTGGGDPDPPTGCSALYGQCGGQGWSGPKCCAQGACKVGNEWYSQCL
ncbi:hypothetical protein V493_01378 [Pseudogymnoascus sp. VKM F-4281 (FW-2241)]|nr:hypothetical protein V493_01378 [Pseudogymnoascus sp. VKM F-4281 (FW-2241)]